MANVETLTAHARDGRELATVDIRSDSLYFTVRKGEQAIGTIFAPFPGYPHYRKNWEAFSTSGEKLSGIVFGARGALRKIARHAYEMNAPHGSTEHEGIYIMPELPAEEPAAPAPAHSLAKASRMLGTALAPKPIKLKAAKRDWGTPLRTLLHSDGRKVAIGDKVMTFKGEKYRVTGWPSNGRNRVWVESGHKGKAAHTAEFFPDVCGLHWGDLA